MQLAYEMTDEEGDAAKAGKSADERYASARQLAPDAYELVFWWGIELAKRGDMDAARRELRIAFDADQRWRTTLEHLAAGRREGLTPDLAAQLSADVDP